MQLTNYITQTDEWEKRANKVLSHFNYQHPDEIDMFDICWRYGIGIKPLELDFIDKDINFETIKHLKAFSVPKAKARRGTIYIRTGLDAVEKKLLLAEEFCHCYSHYASQVNMDKHSIGKLENQAKRMAAYLLMPAEFLRNVYTVAYYEPVLISDIADYFTVTEEFAYFRMELIYKHRIDALLSHGGKLGSVEWL